MKISLKASEVRAALKLTVGMLNDVKMRLNAPLVHAETKLLKAQKEVEDYRKLKAQKAETVILDTAEDAAEPPKSIEQKVDEMISVFKDDMSKMIDKVMFLQGCMENQSFEMTKESGSKKALVFNLSGSRGLEIIVNSDMLIDTMRAFGVVTPSLNAIVAKGIQLCGDVSATTIKIALMQEQVEDRLSELLAKWKEDPQPEPVVVEDTVVVQEINPEQVPADILSSINDVQ